jgi:HAMP domain-containing protein
MREATTAQEHHLVGSDRRQREPTIYPGAADCFEDRKPPAGETFLNLPRIRSLRTRIALLCVGVSAVLAISLSALGYSMTGRGLRESMKTTLHAEGLVTANLAEGWARDRLASLRAVASLGRVRGYLETATAPAAEDQAAADVAVGDATSMAEEIESIALLDSHGKIVLSSSTADASGSLSNDDHVKAALAGTTSITGVRQSSISDLPAIVLAVPVLGSNATPIGLARASLTLSPLTAFVEAARDRAGPGANGTLIDQNGLVIASTLSAGLAGHALVAELPELAPVAQSAGRELLQLRLQGIDQLAVVEPLPSTHWVYVASLPLAVAERTARLFLRRAALAVGVGLLGAMVLSMFVASRIVRSLVRLTEVSARIVAGNLTQHIEVSSDDEVGVLASGFVRMVEALREVLGTLRVFRRALGGVRQPHGDDAGAV